MDVLPQEFGRISKTPSPLPDLYGLALAPARRLTCAVLPTLALCSPVQQGIELELRRSHTVIRLDLMLNGSNCQFNADCARKFYCLISISGYEIGWIVHLSLLIQPLVYSTMRMSVVRHIPSIN